jgi:dTDP-4-amino-4,6-dideoxygalactose transaminase
MPDRRVPLSNLVIGEEELAAITEVYRSGWLTMGPRTAELERQFADYVGTRHAVAVSSGTAALHLICLAAGVGPGDEVVVPSLTFVATANAIKYTGATPVFADVRDLERPWLSADAVEAAIGERTKAIMAMSYGGHPGEIEALASLASSRDLVLLEDAAHGLGARVGGRRLGTFGLAAAFSFFSNKNLPVGEGGMVVTDDDEVAEQSRLLRSHGMTKGTWERFKGETMSYDVVGLGFNYRIDEPRATLASARLPRLDDANRRRG